MVWAYNPGSNNVSADSSKAYHCALYLFCALDTKLTVMNVACAGQAYANATATEI